MRPTPSDRYIKWLIGAGAFIILAGMESTIAQPTDGPWRRPTPAELYLFYLGVVLEIVGFSLICRALWHCWRDLNK